MSIASELTNLENNIGDAYDAVSDMSGIIPQHKNMANLDQAIRTIPQSSVDTMSIPKEVLSDGTLGPKQSAYTFATTATKVLQYELAYAFSAGANKGGGITSLDLESITTGAQYAFYYCCNSCKNLTTLKFPKRTGTYLNEFYLAFTGCTSLAGTLDMSSLQTIGNQNAFTECFEGCSSLTGVNLSSLTTISGGSGANYMFYNCSSLKNINLSSLATITGQYGASYMFNGTAIENTNFLSALTTINNTQAFSYGLANCPNLTTATFQNLSTIKGANAMQRCFQNDTALTSVSFPALTSSSFSQNTVFNNMLQGCSNVTVHFPTAVQSTIGSWSDVTNGFGGTNTTVLFDL